MELFGTPIETIYLYTLFIIGALTVLFIFFGDAAHGTAAGLDFLNPVIVLAFITFMSATGYILEKVTSLNSYLILVIAVIISFILDVILNIFVLLPLSKAEESLVYTAESLNGRVGKVIITIPANGFGEVVLESTSGMISKSARSFDDSTIKEGATVLVIDAETGFLTVKEYEHPF